MLVLTRRANQSIVIGHDVVVTVLEVRGDQVRLGIRAPRSVDVHREEVFLELTKANRSAASPSPSARSHPASRRRALYQSALISTALPRRGVTTQPSTLASIQVSWYP